MPPITQNYSPDVEKALRHYNAESEAALMRAEDRKKMDFEKGISTTFNDFIKYIVALLDAQTPDNPVDPKEMAEFFLLYGNTQSVKRQTDMIEEMKKSYDNAQVMFAADQVGKIAQVKSKTFEYDPQEKTAITYEMPEGAEDVDIVVSRVDKRRGEGAMMANDMGLGLTQLISFKGEKNPGKHHLSWDGKIPDPQRKGQFIDAPKGAYHIDIIARDKEGKQLFDKDKNRAREIPTWVTGIVTGAAKTEKGEPCIKIGDSSHSINDVAGFEKRTHYQEKAESPETVKELYRMWENTYKNQEKDWKQRVKNLSYLDLQGL